MSEFESQPNLTPKSNKERKIELNPVINFERYLSLNSLKTLVSITEYSILPKELKTKVNEWHEEPIDPELTAAASKFFPSITTENLREELASVFSQIECFTEYEDILDYEKVLSAELAKYMICFALAFDQEMCGHTDGSVLNMYQEFRQDFLCSVLGRAFETLSEHETQYQTAYNLTEDFLFTLLKDGSKWTDAVGILYENRIQAMENPERFTQNLDYPAYMFSFENQSFPDWDKSEKKLSQLLDALEKVVKETDLYHSYQNNPEKLPESKIHTLASDLKELCSNNDLAESFHNAIQNSYKQFQHQQTRIIGLESVATDINSCLRAFDKYDQSDLVIIMEKYFKSGDLDRPFSSFLSYDRESITSDQKIYLSKITHQLAKIKSSIRSQHSEVVFFGDADHDTFTISLNLCCDDQEGIIFQSLVDDQRDDPSDDLQQILAQRLHGQNQANQMVTFSTSPEYFKTFLGFEEKIYDFDELMGYLCSTYDIHEKTEIHPRFLFVVKQENEDQPYVDPIPERIDLNDPVLRN